MAITKNVAIISQEICESCQFQGLDCIECTKVINTISRNGKNIRIKLKGKTNEILETEEV